MEEKTELQNSQICNLCGQVFKNESQLSQHCLIHQARRLYPCTVCRKSFTLEANLEQHVLIHEGIKPYACTSCDKTFTHKSHMEEHALIHIGIKPYICDTCEKGFTLQSSLARHSLIHRGLKRHRCSVCGKEFARKTHLSQHSITHTGVKPHVCNICGRGFTTKGNMKKHTLLHGERSKTSAVDQVAENPLVCAERGESFSRKGIQPKEHRSFHEDDDGADSSAEEKAHGCLPKGEMGLAGSDSLTAFSGSGNSALSDTTVDSFKVEEPYSQEGQDLCNFVGIKSEYDEQYLENYDAS